MIKKNLLLILSVLFSVFANAAILEYGGLRYNILKSDGIAEVVGYGSAPTGALVIPESVYFEGVLCSVKTIANGAFYGCAEITSVEIPNSVETIGHSAFEECRGIETVSIGENVTFIGDCAFCYCSSLTALYIPAKVDSIGVCAFIRCYNIESITVSDSNKKFDSRGGCNAIIETATNTLIAGCQNTVIPETVTGIGFRAFYEQSKLENLIIPNSVTTIGDESIRDCFGLKTLTIGSGVTEIGYTAILYRSTALTDIYCYAVEPPAREDTYSSAQVTLHVPEEALEAYKSTAPWNEFGNIVAITKYAEDVEIGNLTYNINTDSMTAEVSGYVTEPTGELVIPESVVYEGAVCKVTAICESAFDGCSDITSVAVPSTVARMDDNAFLGCTSLTAVHISDLEAWCNIQFGNEASSDDYSNPIYYANHLFLNEEEIVDLIIPESIDTVKARAFVRCNGLQSVTFPEGVKSIGIASFRECNGLTSLQIPNTVKEICAYAFFSCGNLSSVRLSDSIERIGVVAFSCPIEMHISDLAIWCGRSRNGNLLGSSSVRLFLNGEEIKDLVIPEGVTTIGSYAFSRCSGLTSVVIPGSVKTIELDAFANCSGLETVTFSEGLEQLGQGVFYSCPSLKEVVLPNTLKSIGSGAFRECDSLTTVTLGASTDSIASYAFGGTSLTDLYCYAQTLPETHSEIFVNGASGDYSTLERATLHVPEEALETYKSTAPWNEFGNIVAIAKYAEDVEIGNLTYNINTDSLTAEVSGYVTEPTGELVIPESVMYEGAVCKVTAIGSDAFNRCSGITSVVIPNSVATIGKQAFVWCTGLSSLSIPNSVTTIEYGAFDGCNGLTSLTIPNGVTTIGSYAFAKCSGLTSVVIPESVDSMGIGVFSSCSGLETISVDNNNPKYDSRNDCNVIVETSTNTLIAGSKSTVIPNDVEAIGNDAFQGCVNLTTIEIPESVREIRDFAFENCSGLTSLELPGGLTVIGKKAFHECGNLVSVSIPGSVDSVELDAFANCSELNTVTIAEGVKHLHQGAFYGCSSLKGVVLPNSLKNIGEGAFRDCTSLTTVTLGESTDSIARWAFGGTSLTDLYCYAQALPETHSEIFLHNTGYVSDLSSATLHVPEEALEAYKSTAPWSEFGNIVAITKYAENVEVGNLTYNINTDSLTAEVTGYVTEPTGDLVIPESVMYEGAVCKVTAICASAFEGCSEITSVTIPRTVTRMDDAAFKECTGLTAVHISDLAAWCNVDIANQYAHPLNYANHLFLNGEEVVDLVIPDGVSLVRGGVFVRCYGLRSVTIPESVKTIENNAFSNCVGLTSIKLLDGVVNIGERAFENCSNLTSVTIPNSVSVIGIGAFSGCTGLTSVVIPNSVEYIASGTFGYCTGLTSVTIPNSVTAIGLDAFSNCTGLTSVVIPNSVEYIELGAFRYSGLESVTISGSVKTIGIDAFAYCYNLKSVTFAEGLEHLNQGAFYNCSSLKEVALPNSLKSIGSGVFRDCTSLTTVTLGASTDSIASWAFGGTSLTNLYCYAQALPETHSEIFVNGDGGAYGDGLALDLSGATLHVPEEALAEYSSTAPWSEFGNIVAMRSPVTVTIGSTGATTFCSEYDLDFSDVEGIKAYVATGYNSTTGAITMMRVTEVKAGTGLYIRGEAGVYDVPKAKDVTFNSLNMLVGVTAAVSVAPTNGEYTNYVYTKPSGKPAAFYKLTSARNVPAGKSYLQIPTLWLSVASEARIMLDFDDWDATGIDDVEDTSVPGEQIIYDLQGRRVTNPTKGIYIVNGKKVLYR